ncbi:type VI secretion system contractile sheath small subunit [Dyella monticola]|uniref:Type VI secretion system contractile sheath small subunit n=1 Tax=Dyella monticola TaxID=1927958 RepID=A0A370X6A3_9GAMM|nr:type VI secretion system contractile sheath small subunit [Dyella monticola]RDS83886.1 type VI secretion system contractile sheath small subunit [Dyella monticola]
MSTSYQNELPKARINLKLDLHTGGAQKKMELPLKLLVTGDFSNGQDTRAVAERQRIDINKNNFDAVLAVCHPKATITIENKLAGDGTDMSVDIDFTSMDDFKPEVIASKVPELRTLMAARHLLRDLKSNLLDNATFRRELEKILKDQTLSHRLRDELHMISGSALSQA